MGKIISTTECKTILQISGSAYDAFINTMIPITENFILKYCGITEESASVEPGLKLAAANLINYQLQKPTNVTAESIGNYSVSYTNSYPVSLLSTLKPYVVAGFVQDDTDGDYYSDILLKEFMDLQ